MAKRLREILPDALKLITLENNDTLSGLSTGLSSLDRLTRGLPINALTIVAGRPGMGKSILVSEIILHQALKKNISVGVFSFALGATQWTTRFLHRLADVSVRPSEKEKNVHDMHNHLEQAYLRLMDAQITVEDQPNIDPDILVRQIEAMKYKHHLDFLAIDGLENIGGWECGLTFGPNWFLSLVQDINIPILITAPISDAIEKRDDHYPTLADLPFDGGLGMVAKLVLFIYRSFVYNSNQEDRDYANIIVPRNLHGPTGIVTLKYHPQIYGLKDIL